MYRLHQKLSLARGRFFPLASVRRYPFLMTCCQNRRRTYAPRREGSSEEERGGGGGVQVSRINCAQIIKSVGAKRGGEGGDYGRRGRRQRTYQGMAGGGRQLLL